MFDYQEAGVGFWPGESPEEMTERLAREDQLAYEETCRAMADGSVEEKQHFLPAGFDDIPPGVFLAAIVSTVDPERLNGHDAVRLMKARARLVSHHEAGKLEAMAEVAFSPPGDADSGVERSVDEMEYASVEVAAALRLTRRFSEAELDGAVCLKHRLGRVLSALSRGSIDPVRARIFGRQLGHLPADTVDEVLDGILSEAAELTSGQLGDRLAKLVLEADPDGSKASFQEGLADRKMTAYPNPDHTANLLIGNGDPADIAAARAHVERLARGLKTVGEPRTLDELRHDVAVDLLKGQCACRQPRYSSSGGGRININVTAETLAGLSDQPAELAGYGPVFAEIARKTVRENIDGEWTFVVTDNGQPVATGTLARRPTASQQRQIQAQKPECVMVGCRFNARDCDLDHHQPRAAGGPTQNSNLAPLCRHHHMTRHHGNWQYQQLDNGDHQWTSPLGHTYTQRRGPPD
jgi:hypothetical protein